MEHSNNLPKLSWVETDSVRKGTLTYILSDFSFNFHPASEPFKQPMQANTTSISLRTLQIEVSITTRELLYVWGFLPNTSWKRQAIILPKFHKGHISLLGEAPKLQKGVALSYKPADSWVAIADDESGWIRFGNDNSDAIEFAEGIALSVEGELVSTIWLHPTILSQPKRPGALRRC
jgi:hypothetical protein